MKRTFQQASQRGNNKYVIKGICGAAIQKLSNLTKGLLTEGEQMIIEDAIYSLTKLSDNDRFDKATAELGFKVWRYDFLVIENGTPFEKTNQSSTEYKFWKKNEELGLKIQVTNKYLL
jgi:hypothetical protein